MGSKDYKVKKLTVDDTLAVAVRALFVPAPDSPVGLGTETPFQNLAGENENFMGSGLHIKGPGTTRLIVEGSASTLETIALDADANARAMAFITTSGNSFFRSRKDDLNTQVDNIILMNHLTGNVSIAKALTVGGDLDFSGAGSGLFFGECFGHEIGWAEDDVNQNQWYSISSGNMSSGLLNNVVHDGNGELTLASAGVYRVSYKITAESSRANEHLHSGIEINSSGTPASNSINHNETKFALQETPLGKTCYLAVTAGQTINAMIQTDQAGEPDITVDDLSITAEKIGGV